jgi:SAM-dependent methyltransferase
MTVAASEKSWNSPTTLYLARSLSARSDGGTLTVLDLGCGDGSTLEQLADSGHDLFGCDLPERRGALEKRLAPVFGDSFTRRIRTVADEDRVPFADDSFDIVYANQVFEHVRNLEATLRECHRVLKPRGTLLATFPPATCPLEVHLGIPFAHWLPAGPLRVRYLHLVYGLGLRPLQEGSSAGETARRQDRYLRDRTFYRTAGGTVLLASAYFNRVRCETDRLISAKLDMLGEGASPPASLALPVARALNGKLAGFLVSRLFLAAYSFAIPSSLPDPREPLPCPA